MEKVTRKPATKGRPRKAKRTPVKKTAKRTAGRRIAKKAPAKRRGPAGNPAWQKKMRDGRVASDAIDRYMNVLAKPRKRMPSAEKIARINRELATTGPGAKRLIALQALADAEVALLEAGELGGERKEAEDGFVKHAKAFSERHGISYATWRGEKVPAAILKRAGITQTRLA